MDSGVKAAGVGANNTCAIKNGALFCWGYNGYGQLGTGSTNGQANTAPQQVNNMDSGVIDVSVGYYTICAIKTGGALFCWGAGAYGQIGDGANLNRFVPTAVSGMGSGVTAVSVSDGDQADGNGVPLNKVCAIKNGALYCWGWGGYGQIGDGTDSSRNVPTAVSGMEDNVTAVASGEYGTCAIKNSQVYCWGYNGNGELGIGDTQNRWAPARISTFIGKSVTQLTSGRQHFCAVADNKLHCWGWNANGQLGIGNNTNSLTPALIVGFESNVTSIAAGIYSSYAIYNNKLYSWGENGYGQLGRGNNMAANAPVAILDLQ